MKVSRRTGRGNLTAEPQDLRAPLGPSSIEKEGRALHDPPPRRFSTLLEKESVLGYVMVLPIMAVILGFSVDDVVAWGEHELKQVYES